MKENRVISALVGMHINQDKVIAQDMHIRELQVVK